MFPFNKANRLFLQVSSSTTSHSRWYAAFRRRPLQRSYLLKYRCVCVCVGCRRIRTLLARWYRNAWYKCESKSSTKKCFKFLFFKILYLSTNTTLGDRYENNFGSVCSSLALARVARHSTQFPFAGLLDLSKDTRDSVRLLQA